MYVDTPAHGAYIQRGDNGINSLHMCENLPL